jgi:hypothetical protein
VNFAAADKRLIGRMIDVEITAVLANSLGGRLVESLASAVA